MNLVAIVIGFALIEYFVFGLLVGRARGQYGVAAPAMSGHPIFERYMRVHQNTLEQLVVFVPAMLIFGVYVSGTIAALLGLVWIAGRALYLRGYVADPARRSTGFALTALPQLILLLGGIVGAVLAAR
jgi:glutathione S-transferase